MPLSFFRRSAYSEDRMSQSPRLIESTEQLTAFCERLSTAEFVTVDTEFMREKTYWPQLCLVQVAGPDDAEAIDPLAPGLDLAPLFEMMANRRILKVFHAARQDLEIFHHMTGQLPDPVFDTQVAAMVCGFGDQVGYETLIAKLGKTQIDKSSRFTDWSLRPLSQRQVDYALADVTHLRPAYEKLRDKLKRNGRENWLTEEMAVLTDPVTYLSPPEESWRRIKTRVNSRRFAAVLRELAAWRERAARHLDLPRNRVLRDESLVEIAHHAPKTVEELARTRGLGRRMAEGAQGAAILAAVEKGLSVHDDDIPTLERGINLPPGIGPLSDLLKVLLKHKSEELGVAQRLIATSTDLDLIAAFGEKAETPALGGWRLDAFGTEALQVCAGRRALAANGRKLRLVEIDETS